MNNYREVIIFAKSTKFETIKLMHGGEYTSNNAKYICNLTTSKADSDVIAYGISECEKIGLELGSITEVSTKKGGFYAGAKEHKKVVYDYAK